MEVDGRDEVGTDRGRREIDDLLAMLAQNLVVPGVRPRRGRVEDDRDLVEAPHRRRGRRPLCRGGHASAARASPSDAGSIPTRAPISSVPELRSTLIIRSVPMLPLPMIAILVDMENASGRIGPMWRAGASGARAGPIDARRGSCRLKRVSTLILCVADEGAGMRLPSREVSICVLSAPRWSPRVGVRPVKC
jgi:hypothetical protein